MKADPKTLSGLKAQIFAKQKILAGIYAGAGSKSLFDYARSWRVPPAAESSGLLFGQVLKLLQKTYPATLAQDAAGHLSQNPLVSTIDHHGILNHPFFINSNLIFSLRNGQKYLICLTTSGVSLNNSSWPGCLLVTGAGGELRRFSFFPDKIKTQSVFAAAAIGTQNIEKILKQIGSDGELNPEQKAKLKNLAEEIFGSPEFLVQKSFSDQASLVSAALWARIFPLAPKPVYLPVEELGAQILAEVVIPDAGHILHRLLFTPNGWQAIEKYFYGSLGAFSAGHKGSFLFWGIDQKGRRAHLRRVGPKITDNNLSFELRADAVAAALRQRQLYPTSLVCFLILLYYGVTCLGGFNQVNWLTDIKEKFVKLLRKGEEENLANSIAAAVTDNFAEGSLAFGVNGRGKIYKPTALDLYLQGDEFLFEKYQELAGQITVGESIESQLAEIYRVITPGLGRKAELLALTDELIMEQNGLAAKVRKVLR